MEDEGSEEQVPNTHGSNFLGLNIQLLISHGFEEGTTPTMGHVEAALDVLRGVVYLTYGVLLWVGALKKHMHKLQVLQNKTVRKITNAKYNDPVKPIDNELGIFTLDNLYKTEL